MKDSFNHIDELLKQSLEGYKKDPSNGVWKRISFRLWLNELGIYLIFLAVLIVVLSGSFIYLNKYNSKSNKIFVTAEKPVNMPEEVNLDELEENLIQPAELIGNNMYSTKSDYNVKLEKHQKSEISTFSQNTSILSKNRESVGLLSSDEQNTPETSELTENKKTNFAIYPGLEKLVKPDKPKSLEINTFSDFYLAHGYFPKIYSRTSYLQISPAFKDDYGRRGLWSYGLHLTPEIIFTNDNNNSKKNALNIDITSIYSVKDWFIQFGVGIGLSEDDGNYRIDYAQYDSIGYFYKVTGFSINPENGDPVYTTNVENVYDTVLYNQTKTSNNLYTYLRLPVFAGIKVHEYKRFSVSVKAGGIYSILINKNEPGTDFTNENATWITITNETPQRIQSNLQLSFAVGLTYQLSSKLSINLEPVYNYFINPVYQQNLNSKSPWSLGLRAGIVVQF